MRWRLLLMIAAALVAMALMAVVGLFAFRDLTADAVRRVVVPRLEAITHRDVSITGDFDLIPSVTPTLAVEGLAVANAPWGSRPTMLQAERVEVEVQLLPLLLRRDVVIERLALVGADVMLERGPEGQVNWAFGPAPPERAERRRELLLNEVSIEDSRLMWYDAASGRSETVTIEQLVGQADSATGNIVLSGAGQFDQHPFTLAGVLGPVATLRRGDEPYPIALKVTLADLELELDGQLSPGREAQLEVRLAGESLASVGDLLERQLPELGAFEFEGRLTGPLEELALTDLSGRIGADAGLQIVVTDGRIEDVLRGQGIRLPVQAAGPSVAALGDLVGRELPELGPYEVQGQLTGSIDDLALGDLTGTIGGEGVGLIRITDGRIENVLAGEGIRVQLGAAGEELARLAAAAGVELAPFGPYQFEGTLVGSLESLALQNASATAGDERTRIELAGAIADVLQLSGLDLAVTIEGESLAALSPIVRIDLQASEPYRIAGDVSGSITDLRIENLEVHLADSTLRGWLAVHLRDAAPPLIEGELVADRLDLDRLLELARRAGGDEREPSAAPSADGRGQLFATAALRVDVLNELEADLTLGAEEVVLDQLEFTDVSLDLMLRDGRLSVQDLVAHIEDGGTVAGNVALEAEAGTAQVSIRLSANDIPVGGLLHDFGATEKVVGKVDIEVNLATTGRSIDELIDNLRGRAAIAADDGRIEDAQLNRLVADLDILKALPPFWERNETVLVNCLVGQFDIENGVARTGAILDSQRMTPLVEGTVDLRTKTLDLELRPVPKDQKLSTIAIPVAIEGSLEHPEIKPRTGTAAAQAARGVLGGLLIPLNQIAALFGQESVDACAEALRQAQERREQQASQTE